MPPLPPPPPPSPRRTVGLIVGGIAGVALIACGFVLLLHGPTPTPKDPVKPADVPPKAATVADQRVIDWVQSRHGTVPVRSRR